ncbi:hypothetical protein Z043_100158 [Scleropages formosus]|uniref:Acid-sensing ion channel 2-like n=1 Tax=Scleropages formosus TaxID=113540 RepID=A0A0P7V1X9_SCLFO|nr:hypothetical protein Z043_100158 [Scleropages formosus]
MDLKESCGSEASGGSLRPSSWQLFAHRSTLHGLRFVFAYGPLTLRRLLWAAALLTSLGLLALESAERLAYFFSYPHVTRVDAVVSDSLVFPVVTICNLNPYRFTKLTRNDLYHAGELLDLLDVHLRIQEPHLAEPEVLEFLSERANFTGYKPKPFSMKEFTERVGHDLKEMMLYCRFQGHECSHRDFKTGVLFPPTETSRRKCWDWGQPAGTLINIRREFSTPSGFSGEESVLVEECKGTPRGGGLDEHHRGPVSLPIGRVNKKQHKSLQKRMGKSISFALTRKLGRGWRLTDKRWRLLCKLVGSAFSHSPWDFEFSASVFVAFQCPYPATLLIAQRLRLFIRDALLTCPSLMCI